MLCALVLLLSVSVCSVSAASSLTDWVPWQPYRSDFIAPAGSNSVVFDFARNDNVYRRLVLPDGAESIQCVVEQNGCLVTYVAYGDNAGSYMYYGANFSSYNYLKSSKPELDGYYSYRIYVDLKTYGIVCNSSTVNFVDQWDLHIIKPFPDENLIEEKKTQGMISQLIQDIKDWFSNLIESMGNFFTELGNKISSGFTALGDRIKGFFTQLVEDIKGLFIPSDGFFDEYSNNFELWAREHFGFLFESIELVDTTINKFIDFSPSDNFSVTLPEASFTIRGKNYVLWEQQVFSVNSLLTSIPALSFFHSVYFTFVYALFFYLLYRLGEKAYTDIFGGSD